MKFKTFFLILFLSLTLHANEDLKTISRLGITSQIIKETGRPPDNCTLCESNKTLNYDFYRDEPALGLVESALYKLNDDKGWEQYSIPNGAELLPTGFNFTMNGPNILATKALVKGEDLTRQWEFMSLHGSKRETYIGITDNAGSGNLSQLMETVIFLFPRKNRPHIEAIGDDLHVTLTTGEQVVFDKKTHLIKSGVLTEGPIDLNPDKNKRKAATINYSGSGIMIKIDARGEKPQLNQANAPIFQNRKNAIVTQNGKTCEIPAKNLWDQSAYFNFSDDEKLIDFLNKNCVSQFSLSNKG